MIHYLSKSLLLILKNEFLSVNSWGCRRLLPGRSARRWKELKYSKYLKSKRLISFDCCKALFQFCRCRKKTFEDTWHCFQRGDSLLWAFKLHFLELLYWNFCVFDRPALLFYPTYINSNYLASLSSYSKRCTRNSVSNTLTKYTRHS